MPTEPMQTIDRDELANVAGGARVTSRGSDDVTLMLTQITNSIKDLAGAKNQNDPTQLLLLMMMMGGMGGGGGGVIAAPAAAAGPPVINIDTSVLGGGGPRFGMIGVCPRGSGKKGW